MDSLLTFIFIAVCFIDFSMALLTKLSIENENNGLFYNCTLTAALKQHGEKDVVVIKILNVILTPLFTTFKGLKPKDTNSCQLLNFISKLLNIQVNFFLQKW